VAGGEAMTRDDGRGGGRDDRRRTTDDGSAVVSRPPSVVAASEPLRICIRRALLNHIHHRATGGNRCVVHGDAAVAQGIFQAQLHWIHAQCLGQFVHLRLGHKQALRRTKATEGAAGYIVGDDGTRINGHVGNDIRPNRHDGGIAQHFGAGVGIRASVAHQINLCGN